MKIELRLIDHNCNVETRTAKPGVTVGQVEEAAENYFGTGRYQYVGVYLDGEAYSEFEE